MITIRDAFCAIMLASAASLFAMDADKKEQHTDPSSWTPHKDADYIAGIRAKWAYNQEYAYQQAKCALDRVPSYPWEKREEIIEMAVARAQDGSDGIHDSRVYDGIIATVLEDVRSSDKK